MKSPSLEHAARRGYEEVVTEDPRLRTGCRHYWIIDRATGSSSRGTCRICGARRQFQNYLSDCLANADKEGYHEWLNKQEWQEVVVSQDVDIAIPELGGGKLPASQSGSSLSRRGKGASGTRKGTTT
jgi:hypothetical protein